MNNNYAFMLLALFTGALIPIQAAMNASLNKHVGNTVFTAGIVLLMGLLTVALVTLLRFKHLPTAKAVFTAPSSSFFGGVIVATYILLITLIIPRLGAGIAIGLILCGQIISALLIDQFGLFSIDVRKIDLPRVIGVLLMFAGIYLVMKRKG